jgi:hypothetical protein
VVADRAVAVVAVAVLKKVTEVKAPVSVAGVVAVV